jgi:hypothetical protein
MTPHLSASPPARLLRPWPIHGRAVQAVTYLAIVGLSITVVLLAPIRTATSAPRRQRASRTRPSGPPQERVWTPAG